MRRLLSLALLCSLAACGGGSSGGSTGVPNTPVGSGTSAVASLATVTFTLTLPASTAAAAARKSQYISASMQSLVVTLTSQNGVPVATQQPYAANIGSSACSTSGGPGSVVRTPLSLPARTCMVAVPASVGSDTFTVATYDVAQSSVTPTALTGNLLSTATVTSTVVSGVANNVPIILNSVIASIAIALASTMPHVGTPATIGVLLTVKDADGNFIIGPGNYTSPISLLDTDGTGATTLMVNGVAGNSVPNPAAAVTLFYNGGNISIATIFAAATGATGGSAILMPQLVMIWPPRNASVIADESSIGIAL